jgi:hypothetical protein
MITTDLAALREKALAATPGKWENGFCKDGVYCGKAVLVTSGGVEIMGPRQIGRPQKKEVEENAAYIAAANPQVILALIEEIENLRKDIENILNGPTIFEEIPMTKESARPFGKESP